MDKETFNKYYQNLLRKASAKRTEKEIEYFSTEDVLRSFRAIANFRGTTTPVTIMDLSARALVSISGMVNNRFTLDEPLEDERPTLEQWDEKFIDALNYLIKLYASIREYRDE